MLDGIFASICAHFPGITFDPRKGGPTALIATEARVQFAIEFDDGPAGESARFALHHILHVNGLSPGDVLTAACFRFSTNPATSKRVLRMLGYASELVVPAVSNADPMTHSALPTLLGRALLQYKFEYDGHGTKTDIPSLPVLLNVLKPLYQTTATRMTLRRKSMLSRRVLKVAVDNLLDWRLIQFDSEIKPARQQRLTLTESGRKWCEIGLRVLRVVEHAWRKRFAAERIDRLRAGLRAVTESMGFEVPAFIVGYGVADESLTGGNPHGDEWQHVRQTARVDHSDVSLIELMSKSLMLATIEYESLHGGPLACTLQTLCAFPPQGTTLGLARAFGVKGEGRATLERHLAVVVDPDRAKGRDRKVYPTPRTLRSVKLQPALLAELEQLWRTRYGAETIGPLRTSLELVNAAVEPEAPIYPDTTQWLTFPRATRFRTPFGYADEPTPAMLWGSPSVACHAGLDLRPLAQLS